MPVKLVLPRPPERYDSQAEAQRNLLLESAFAQLGTSAGATSGGTTPATGGGVPDFVMQSYGVK